MRDPVQGAEDALDSGLEGLLARLADAAIVWEAANGRIRHWNPAAVRLFGYAAVEVLGKPLSMLMPEGPFEGAIARGPVELAARRRDGTTLFAELTLSPFGRDEDGLVLAIARDVTDRRASEAARDRFLNVLSHELRTPISTILGFGELVLDGLAGSLTEQQRHYLRRMLVSADDLHALVNDLLDLGQLQAGQFTLRPRVCQFAPMAREVIADLMPQAEAKQLTIHDELPSDLPEIRADGKRVAQVLRNLLGNAIKFSPPEGRIWIRGGIDGQSLHCEIEDMGPGVPESEYERLFMPFVRLGSGTLPGSGLGLNIAKALVEAHQGRIGIRRAEAGAIFWFTLPHHAMASF